MDQRFQISCSETNACISLDSLGGVTVGVLVGENFDGNRKCGGYSD